MNVVFDGHAKAKIKVLWTELGQRHYRRYAAWLDAHVLADGGRPDSSLLSCANCFWEFSKDHKVWRQVNMNSHSIEKTSSRGLSKADKINRSIDFASKLQDKIKQSNADLKTAAGIEQLTFELGSTKTDEKALTTGLSFSWVSKIAAMLYPADISPWDKYAYKGAKIIANGSGTASPILSHPKDQERIGEETILRWYQERCRNWVHTEDFIKTCADIYYKLNSGQKPISEIVFRRRILDLWLMEKGGAFKLGPPFGHTN